MGIKTKTFLKDSNKDFNNVLDSMVVIGDDNAITGANTFSGRTVITGGLNSVPEILTPAATQTLTAAQAGKLLLIPSTATGTDDYLIPIPTFIGQTYNLCWSGIVADADNVLIMAVTADAFTFTGMLLDFDTDDATVAGYVMVKPGAANDKLTMVNPEYFDITLTATTLTNYHVRGFAMSTDTASTFGDL